MVDSIKNIPKNYYYSMMIIKYLFKEPKNESIDPGQLTTEKKNNGIYISIIIF
jgi:hypothetical protein